ncbi:hypothetical protein [Williamsia muralis]|uniref:Antibiotic biosynthesis monooxygenase n=1 Tax=Williamsia marianensis TaxID=85044 RepID=A0ABU4EQY6_WILMA|nr:hypothetical protein [Williamsia muralis]MDV7133032.1 hypothetical protein [Williamsia muralis]
MSVQMVRFRTSPEHSAAVVDEIAALFAAVHAAAPSALHYIALEEIDEPVFTLILELTDGVENPLPSIPAAASFRSWLPGQTDDDPKPRRCTVLGRYSA